MTAINITAIINVDEELIRRWLGALVPPLRVQPSVFAEDEIRLPASTNALPGPLRLAPYQTELVDAIAADDCEVVVMMLSSQTGKSISIDSQLGYCIACDPGPMLHVSPTSERSEEFVRDRFNPLVAASPALRALVGKGQAKRQGGSGGTNSINSKSFPGGQLNFASSYKPDELAAKAIKYLYLDECDRFALTAGAEGCPIALAMKRTKTFEGKGRKVVMVSTPTTRGGSRINQYFLKGDQRRYFVSCPDCGHQGPMSFENLKWDEGKPETAHLVCEECGCAHDEAQRRAMIDGGEWRATARGELGIRSYHLNELASKFSTMAAVAQQFESAKTPLEKQAFYNTTLAQTYDTGMEVELNASALEQRAEEIVAPYANDIVALTCGVDVQGDRLEATHLAFHSDETCTVLDHVVIKGDTSGNAVWSDFDASLDTVYPLADGRRVTFDAIAIDAGFNVDQVVKFIRQRRAKRRQILAPVVGRAGFERMPLATGARNKGQMRLMVVGVDTVKHAVQKRLSLETLGPGFIRLPRHLPPEYFEGLASEELRTRNVRGVPKYEYHRTVRRNEPLDCLAYAYAIAGMVTPKKRAASSQGEAKPHKTYAQLIAELHVNQNT